MKVFTNYELFDIIQTQNIEAIYTKNHGFITRKEIDEKHIPSWFLSDFVKKNRLIRIAPGFYASAEYTVDDYFILQRRYPKYIFSGIFFVELFQCLITED